MPFKLAFASNAMKRYSLDEAIDLVADAGYQGIEILLDPPHAFPPQVKEEDVKNAAPLVDGLGADSLDPVELVMALEEEFDTESADEEAEKITTVQAAIDYITANQE